MTIFAPYLRTAEPEEKKDVFAPVADLMVGVVFIFIIMVLALSLFMMDDIENAVPRSMYEQKVSELETAQGAVAKAETDRDEARKTARIEGKRADREEAARGRLAEFVRYVRDLGIVPVLSRLAESDKRRTEILEKLKERLLASNIKVDIDAENGTLRLPSAKLFESGKADPTPAGTAVIKSLGIAIADIVPCYLATTERPASCSDIRGAGVLSAIYIEGHTDAAPFKNAVDRFRNNWDLSAARAIAAFHIVRDSDPGIVALRNAEGQALVGVSGYADTRPARQGMLPEQRLEETVKDSDRRIEVRLIMAVDRQEVLSGLQEINNRLERLDVDLR
jgi:flagellar motor protein MotB